MCVGATPVVHWEFDLPFSTNNSQIVREKFGLSSYCCIFGQWLLNRAPRDLFSDTHSLVSRALASFLALDFLLACSSDSAVSDLINDHVSKAYVAHGIVRCGCLILLIAHA